MRHEYLPAGTIIVASSNSACNACGRDCIPDEREHITEAGYGGRGWGHGCGIRFTHITTFYVGRETATAEMRPDLEYVPLFRTRTGKVLMDSDIEELADEAERGYDVDHLKRDDAEQGSS